MEMRKKKLPIGIENFEKLRLENFYYIDKTGLIRELLNNWGEVNLFTRPRRFGKTLNMSMLENFFSLDGDKSIFDGLEISKETALCEEYMGKYPVVSISLKGIDAWSYETAYQMAVRVIIDAAAKFYFLLDSEKLNAHDKAEYQKLLDDTMNEGMFGSSLKLLSGMLEKHYGTKVILLIDEYDVPLAKSHANGYYDQMISLIRSLLGEVAVGREGFFAVIYNVVMHIVVVRCRNCPVDDDIILSRVYSVFTYRFRGRAGVCMGESSV